MYESPRKNINIAVFRGGNENHGKSIKEGQHIISLLTKEGVNVTDVYLDDAGNFIKNGIAVEPHLILSNVDGYIDTTDHQTLPHHDLAHRMGIKNIVSHKEVVPVSVDRESVYRILRQAGIEVPSTYVIRKTDNDFIKKAKEVWTKLNTPFLVRPVEYTTSKSSSLVKSFADLIKAVSAYHDSGHDVHVLSYKSLPTYSTAVLPNYRGEDYYTPLAVETLLKKHEVPNKESVIQVYIRGDMETKEKIRNITKEVARVLQVSGPVCVDILLDKNKCVVVNVDLKPSLHQGGRFMLSVNSTGCNIVDYLSKKLENN